jgi:hypothetical protein
MLCIGYGEAKTGEGFSPRMQTPHPALRATFSHRGSRKKSHP